MDTIQTNPPTAKTPIRKYFWRFGRFRLLRTGIGSIIMARSVAMFIPALKKKNANWLMHLL